MKRNRLLSTIAGGVAVSVLAFAGTAHADQPVDDIAKIVENVPAAVNAAVDGTQASVTVLLDTESVKATVARLGQTVVATGSALVAGTAQFGALGLGFTLINGSLQSALAPYLTAIDDPSTAAGLINPDDLQTIVDNLPAAASMTKDATVMGLTDLLEGDLFNGLAAAVGPLAGAQSLLAGTNYANLLGPVTIGALIVLIAGGTYINDLGATLAPAFESAGPVTGTVIALIQAL